MPARVNLIRLASDKRVGVVAGKIAGWQLRGASNPVTGRGDEHGGLLLKVADIREHLHQNKYQPVAQNCKLKVNRSGKHSSRSRWLDGIQTHLGAP
jgi:hypothetical protein